ncbi:hypothetical protein J2Z21_000431 [Streptomyces griseochromogenes]|uniref:Secreted protein n=1 Tax=Streptomyces griseochromogenes TaxID=68214 RepID=A0A1B1B233_9ACTN|nr:hypothetical protein [Streptomyces griseochromogenes]ANP52879.1 hypothetical protein AVL59_28015 [Streptomyces griseochromogenes]MBP2047509.1 hypothetical protein [Streptomyces griseochromogenes]
MRNSRLLLRSGLTLAAAAALPAPLAGPSAAASGISVSTTGSTVSVVTSSCTLNNGSWGNASLLGGSQTSFAQGRQTALSGTTISQSAAWSGVSPGTYTVVVVCSNGSTAGSQSVIVSATPAVPAAPTIASTSKAAPARGVMGGVGGTTRDYGPLTLGVGAALVGTGIIATAWFLRRRSKPYRL